MKKEVKILSSVGVRVILYAGYLLALSLVFMYDTEPSDYHKFRESSMTEMVQELTLLLTSIILWSTGFYNKAIRPLAYLMGGFFAAAYVREHNAFLDEKLFDGGWQLLAYSIAAITIFLVHRNRSNLLQSILKYVDSRSFGILIMGFIVTFFYSRLYGETYMWKAVMEDAYMRDVKNASEESIELLGYSIILFGAIEFVLWAHKNSNLIGLPSNMAQR